MDFGKLDLQAGLIIAGNLLVIPLGLLHDWDLVTLLAVYVSEAALIALLALLLLARAGSARDSPLLFLLGGFGFVFSVTWLFLPVMLGLWLAFTGKYWAVLAIAGLASSHFSRFLRSWRSPPDKTRIGSMRESVRFMASGAFRTLGRMFSPLLTVFLLNLVFISSARQSWQTLALASVLVLLKTALDVRSYMVSQGLSRPVFDTDFIRI